MTTFDFSFWAFRAGTARGVAARRDASLDADCSDIGGEVGGEAIVEGPELRDRLNDLCHIMYGVYIYNDHYKFM